MQPYATTLKTVLSEDENGFMKVEFNLKAEEMEWLSCPKKFAPKWANTEGGLWCLVGPTQGRRQSNGCKERAEK